MIGHCSLFFLQVNRASAQVQEAGKGCFSKGRKREGRGMLRQSQALHWKRSTYLSGALQVPAFHYSSYSIWWWTMIFTCHSHAQVSSQDLHNSIQFSLHSVFSIYPSPPSQSSQWPQDFSADPSLWPAPAVTHVTHVQYSSLSGCWHLVLCDPWSSTPPFFSTCTLATICQPAAPQRGCQRAGQTLTAIDSMVNDHFSYCVGSL